MTAIRNKNNKKICMVDPSKKIVEILFKGSLTTIQFCNDGRVLVKNV